MEIFFEANVLIQLDIEGNSSVTSAEVCHKMSFWCCVQKERLRLYT